MLVFVEASDLAENGNADSLRSGIEGNTPDTVYMLENTPHDWLFPRVRAAVHHGGAGTTAIGLKCGKPTMIVPFFGDQPFWGAMVAKAGAGADSAIPYKRLTAEALANGYVSSRVLYSLEHLSVQLCGVSQGLVLNGAIFFGYTLIDLRLPELERNQNIMSSSCYAHMLCAKDGCASCRNECITG